MTAALLVGGLGTRVAHLTRGTPKCYVDVGGRRWIDHVLDGLERGGIRHVVLCHDPYGTGGAVKSMLGSLPSDGFWVLNGDTYLQVVYPPVTSPTMLVYPHGRHNTSVVGENVVGYTKGGHDGGWMDLGGWYTPSLWDSTPGDFDMEVIIHKAIRAPGGLTAHRVINHPLEVGSPEGLLDARGYFERLH